MRNLRLLTHAICAIGVLTAAICLLPLRASAEKFSALPERMDSPAKLTQRVKELRKEYEPFQRDFSPQPAKRERVGLVPGTWRFQDDEKGVGMEGGFFKTEFRDDGWVKRDLPEYREFALGWYRIHSKLPKSFSGKRVWLVFEGVDYDARVFVNGEEVGRHRGYFATFRFDVTRFVRPGEENLVAVRVENPFDDSSHPDSFNGKGSGNIAFNEANGIYQQSNGAGIWQPAYFEATGPIAIQSVRTTPILPDRVRIVVALDRAATAGAEIAVEAGACNFEGKAVGEKAQADERGHTFELTLPSPRLWTPETPWLYYCHVTVKDAAGAVSDTCEDRFGLRAITRDDDGTLRLNGRPRMLRGACSFGNFWLASVAGDEEAIVRDILLFKAANLDFTRITVHTLPRIVYRWCDRYGLAVYQDTPLQWAYPMDKERRVLPEVTEAARGQLREMIALLGNHPSVIIWSCMNEFFAADKAFQRAMYDTCQVEDPSRPVVVNSGARSLEGTKSVADRHLYNGWYGAVSACSDPGAGYPYNAPGWPFAPESKGIISEYGNVALPVWETWTERFPWAPRRAEDFWTPRSILPELAYRGLSYGDRVQASVLTARAGEWTGAIDWIENSQLQQARFTRLNTDAWRKRRGQIAGYLFFHLIDPAPLAWPKTLVDCQRRPKRGYFELARASASLRVNLFSPRTRVFGGDETNGLQVWVYNDAGSDFRGRAKVLLLNAAGEVVDEATTEVASKDFSSVQVPIRPLKSAARSQREEVRLVALLEDGQGKVMDFDDVMLPMFPRPEGKGATEAALYDPRGETLAALKAGGAPARKVESLSKEALAGCRLLVVGELCLDGAVASAKDAVLDVARRGGRVVILAQMGEGARGRKRGALGRSVFSPDRAPKDLPLPNWAALPLKGGIMAGSWTSDYVQIDPRWALLKGLEAQDFREWNEMDRVVCESGLSPHPDIAPIATTGQYQRETALGLMPLGKGQVVLCQLVLARRAAHDPVAAEVLVRLISGNRIEVPPVLTVETEAPVEARAGETIKVTTRITNKGDAEAEADVYTLDARCLPTGHQRVKVSAGQTTTTVVGASAAKPWLFSSPMIAVAMGPRPVMSSGAPVVVLGPGEVVRRFDFGSPDSPVAKGYTQVTYQMRYLDARGYGWRSDNGLGWRNRSGPNDLFRDFEHSAKDNTFSVDLPNGQYTCVALIGDQDFPLHPIEVKAEGKIAVDGLKTRTGEYRAEAFQVKVEDGVLDLDFHNRDAGQNWEIAGLVILKKQ